MKPGDAFFARADVRFSHEYVTPMAESLFRLGFGPDATVTEPESVYAFRDHLTFLDLIMPKAHRDMGLDVQARKLAVVQDAFAKRAGIKLYGEVHRDGKPAGSEAICHNKVVEEIALPGQVVVGHRQPHVHGGRARVLRLRRRLDRHGQRVGHARRARHRARDGALRPPRQALAAACARRT